MKKVYVYGLCALFFLGSSSTVQSQIKSAGQNRFVLNADYNKFWQNDSTMYVEISTAVYPCFIVLKQDSSGYHGKVRLDVNIQNKSTNTIIHADRFGIPINISDSTSLIRTGSIVNNMTYALGIGSYTVSIFCTDLNDKYRRDSSSFSVDVTKKPDTIALSDIELCSNIAESSDQADRFYKNTYRVIPNPSCRFGSTSLPIVYTYLELYNLNVGTIYAVKMQIVDSKGDIKKYRIHRRHFAMPNVVDVTTLNVTSIGSGKYYYEAILSDTLGHEFVKSRRPIFIYNPNVELTHASLSSERSAEFAGMSSEELIEEFKTAKYLASSEDMQMFDKLTTEEARREFLAKFWSKIENNELGQSDLTRMIYLQRIQTANQRFKSFAKEGWRTDRGRVYVLYGEPDETQRFPSSSDSKPYEIWNYHQIEGGVEFVFIDLTGFNEYTLVHSTKRGELQDESWEQYLH